MAHIQFYTMYAKCHIESNFILHKDCLMHVKLRNEHTKLWEQDMKLSWTHVYQFWLTAHILNICAGWSGEGSSNMLAMHVHTSTDVQGHTNTHTNQTPLLSEKTDYEQATVQAITTCLH